MPDPWPAGWRSGGAGEGASFEVPRRLPTCPAAGGTDADRARRPGARCGGSTRARHASEVRLAAGAIASVLRRGPLFEGANPLPLFFFRRCVHPTDARDRSAWAEAELIGARRTYRSRAACCAGSPDRSRRPPRAALAGTRTRAASPTRALVPADPPRRATFGRPHPRASGSALPTRPTPMPRRSSRSPPTAGPAALAPFAPPVPSRRRAVGGRVSPAARWVRRGRPGWGRLGRRRHPRSDEAAEAYRGWRSSVPPPFPRGVSCARPVPATLVGCSTLRASGRPRSPISARRPGGALRCASPRRARWSAPGAPLSADDRWWGEAASLPC